MAGEIKIDVNERRFTTAAPPYAPLPARVLAALKRPQHIQWIS